MKDSVTTAPTAQALGHEFGWSEHEASTILGVYERDKMASIPLLPVSFIDRTARVATSSQVWHFAIVLQEAQIGEHCSIGSRSEIGRGTTIGDSSRIGSGVFLPPNSRIGHHVFIGPNVTCTDDRHPRVPEAGDPPYTAEPPVIDDYAVIGAGAVILPGVHIGMGARIAAGAIVTKDVPPNAMVRGTPARFRQMPREWEHANGQQWQHAAEAVQPDVQSA